MHHILAAAWPYALMLAGLLIGAGTTWLAKWRASPAAAKHPIENDIAGIALRIGNEALALLRSNAARTPQDAADWAVRELKAVAPEAAVSVGDDAASAGLNRLARQSFLTVAQSGQLDEFAQAVIKAMAPTAATAKVAPPQLAAVEAAAETAAPDFEAVLLQNLPRLATMVSQLIHPPQSPEPPAQEIAPPAASAAARVTTVAGPIAVSGSLVGPAMPGALS